MPEKPILLAIHNRFQKSQPEPHTDHSVISRVQFRALDFPGYHLTTFPGGISMAAGMDTLVMRVEAKGVFDPTPPTRIEIGRNLGRPPTLDARDIRVTDGRIDISQRRFTQPDLAELVLPGDPGFELFEELHKQIQTLKAPLTEAVGLVCPNVDPYCFDLEDIRDMPAIDAKSDTVVYRSSSRLNVESSPASTVEVLLDAAPEYFVASGLVTEPLPDYSEYVSGRAQIDSLSERRLKRLGEGELAAFARFHKAIETLYK